VGLCTVGSEKLIEVLNRKSVYRTVLLGDENAKVPKSN